MVSSLRPLLTLSLCAVLAAPTTRVAHAGCMDYGHVPGIAGAIDTPGDAVRVTFSGTWAFVADGSAGLQVIDASDPAHPVLAATFDTPGTARDVAVEGTRAYVADGVAGIHIIDITNPSSPALLSSLDTGNARALAIAGNFLYVADPTAGQLQVFLVIDPLHPGQVGAVSASGSRQVLASGSRAYVVGGRLEIFDLTDPANPVLLGVHEPPDGPGMWVSGLAGAVVSGSRVLLAEDWWVPSYETRMSFLAAIDITNPASPSLLSRIRLEGGAAGISVAGTLAAVPSGANGIQFVDVSDPATPVHVVSAILPGSASGACMHGEYAAIASGTAGLQFVSATGLRPAPLVASTGIAPGSGVELVNDHACVWGTGTGAIRVVEIADPAHPAVTDVVIVPGLIRDAAVSAANLYAATTAGLQVVDVSDPHDARLVGNAAIPFDPLSVAAAGATVCVAGTSDAGPEGLAVFDVSSRNAPVLVAVLEIPGGGRRVAMSGPIACVSGEHDGLYVVDVSSPSQPEVIGYDDTYIPADLLLRDGILYAARYGEFAFFDLSEPAHPVMAGALATGAHTFAVQGAFVYVRGGGSDAVFSVIDASDIADPRLVGEACAPGDPLAFAGSGDHVFVVSEEAGLMAFSSQCAMAAGVYSPPVLPAPAGIICSPNPSAGGMVVAFATSRTATLRVAVFEVTGRLVRSVASVVAGKGWHEFAWDGADEAGTPVAPGIYVVRVLDDARARSTRIVIAR